jgi:hypothetical protein
MHALAPEAARSKNRSSIGTGSGAPACVRLLLWLLAAALVDPVCAGVLERALMPGPVAQVHQKYEAECKRCHQSFDRGAQAGLCLDCHQDIAKDVAAKAGLHGRQAESSCTDCHGEHLGVDVRIVKLDEAAFDHARTDFALTGQHAGTACKGCHAANRKHREAPTDCLGCHRADDRHQGRLGKDCGECHTAADWKQVERFDHARTDFPLRDAHTQIECVKCHVKSPVVERLAHACAGCHRDDDPHRGSLGSDCAQCHVATDWKSARFDHAKTGFVLAGAHRDANCSACHTVKGQYKGAAKTCSGCHRADDRHRGTLGDACENCHDSARWKPAPRFDHARTRFALVGGHVKAACTGCHADAAHFRETGKACVACHRKDDSHQGRNGDLCADCHDARDWKRSRFDHDKATEFALRGAHRDAKCEACHTQPVASFKPPSECAQCHAKDDVHQSRLGTQCADCHAEQDWKKSSHVHDRGRFPLIGGHRAAPCKDCHRTQLYADTSRECVACHRTDDRHQGHYGEDCARCHSPREWSLWDFDHRRTDFALTGAHARVRCDACHTPAAGARLSGDCGVCHAQDDAHAGGFGRQCARCHTTTSFTEIDPRVSGKSP